MRGITYCGIYGVRARSVLLLCVQPHVSPLRLLHVQECNTAEVCHGV